MRTIMIPVLATTLMFTSACAEFEQTEEASDSEVTIENLGSSDESGDDYYGADDESGADEDEQEDEDSSTDDESGDSADDEQDDTAEETSDDESGADEDEQEDEDDDETDVEDDEDDDETHELCVVDSEVDSFDLAILVDGRDDGHWVSESDSQAVVENPIELDDNDCWTFDGSSIKVNGYSSGSSLWGSYLVGACGSGIFSEDGVCSVIKAEVDGEPMWAASGTYDLYWSE